MKKSNCFKIEDEEMSCCLHQLTKCEMASVYELERYRVFVYQAVMGQMFLAQNMILKN